MDKSTVVTLVKPVYKIDALNQYAPAGETMQEVFCRVDSVSQSEWASAAQSGFKAAYRVIVWADEYGGATAAILDGQRYGIYRTYQRNGDEIELYLERKVGA